MPVRVGLQTKSELMAREGRRVDVREARAVSGLETWWDETE